MTKAKVKTMTTKQPTETCNACKGTGHLGMVDGRPQICDYCAGEGTVPKLTPEQRANLIAKANAATRELCNAGKLEGSQLGNFARLLHRSAIDDAGNLIARPLELGEPLPFPEVRQATDKEQRDAIAKVAFSARFVPFKISKAELEGAEPEEGFAERLLIEAFEHGFNPMRDLIAETITVDGKLKHRPQGFPVRRVDTCPHGAGRGAICEKCTAAAACVPNRPLLILRMLEIAADLAEQAHRDELPGAPVLDCDFETGASQQIPATLELLHRTINALDAARAWATDRSICFAEHGPCACEKCSPTE